jgi:hypothetical protein
MTSKLDKNDAISDVLLKQEEPTATDRQIRARRLEVDFPIKVTVGGNPIHGFAQAVNLSWSGILIATNFPMAQGDVCTLEFSLPDYPFPLRANAKVVRVQKERAFDEATMIGFAFQALETNVSRMISGFVLEHLDL